MNPKLKKVITDLEKSKEKLEELKERIAELELQRTELENSEIIAKVRSIHLAPEDISEFIENYKKQGLPKAHPVQTLTSGSISDRKETAINADNTQDFNPML